MATLTLGAADLVRRRGLRQMRSVALSLLVLAAVIYVATLHRGGGWAYLNAAAEAAMVGALADWFAVTALFRRPLGLPIPHTAIIPANWELMAARVGTMVGSRVLTREYVTQEIEGVDLAGLLARGAERVTRRDLEALTLTLGRWAAAELTPRAAGDLAVRLRDRLLGRPTAPLLAGVLEVACRRGFGQRALNAPARTPRHPPRPPGLPEDPGVGLDDGPAPLP